MGRRKVLLQAYVELEMFARVTDLARVRGLNRSELVRDALAAYLNPTLPIAGGGALEADDVDGHVDALDRAVNRLTEEELGWPAR